MRVMLMVQNDGGNVRCEGEFALQPSTYANVRTGAPRGTRRQRKVQSKADRWWLVEAESANEARVAIEYARLIPGSAVFESMKDGHKARILASGGRS